MWIATVALPAALDADLSAGRFAAIAGLTANDAPAQFARGIALFHLGRMGEARDALHAVADPALADAAAVEIGFIAPRTTSGSPFVMPPVRPPALFVRWSQPPPGPRAA